MITVDAGVVSYLIGEGVADGRVYYGLLPQGETLPAVTVDRISYAPNYTHSGPSGYEVGRFQFRCWGSTKEVAVDTADEVIAALSGYKGLMGSAKIGASFIANAIGLNDPESGLKSVIVDALIRSTA